MCDDRLLLVCPAIETWRMTMEDVREHKVSGAQDVKMSDKECDTQKNPCARVVELCIMRCHSRVRSTGWTLWPSASIQILIAEQVFSVCVCLY